MAPEEEKWVQEEAMEEPVSPTGQYFNSSALSVSILAVFESEIPIDDSQTFTMLRDVLLPIRPRFSSIMVRDEQGKRHWKRVQVKLEEHVNIPVFPAGLSPESYDSHVQDYLSKIAMEPLPQSRPLWDVHIIKYPTSGAAGLLVVRLHHSMGDGFSLMGVLFSCFKRADDQSLPLNFPAPSAAGRSPGLLQLLGMISDTVADFAFSLLKSNVLEDDQTPVRSAAPGLEFQPVEISTVCFELDHLRRIKASVGGTINDVVTGIVFYGIQLYMENSTNGVSDRARVTALVLLNTRIISTYQSVKEMTKPDAKSPWGNQFGFLHVGVPLSSAAGKADPLGFITQARKIIHRKRNSLAVFLTGRLMETLRRFRGPEATAKYIHATLRNTSMTISNLVGPMEQMAIADHPCKGFYFMVVGVPQSLTITLVSYNGKMRLALGTEKGFIDSKLLAACMSMAFDRMSAAALTHVQRNHQQLS